MIKLPDVLDFILNRCSLRDIEAVAAAVERRKQQFHQPVQCGPEQFVQRVSEALTRSVGESITGIQNSFRDYARDLVCRESPELPADQVEALVRGLVPDVAGRRRSGEAEVEFRGLPPDAVKEMALQFAAFSVGRMPPEEDAALRRALGEWPRVYWSVFPQEIRSIIKSYLENNLEEEVFLASIAVFFS